MQHRAASATRWSTRHGRWGAALLIACCAIVQADPAGAATAGAALTGRVSAGPASYLPGILDVQAWQDEDVSQVTVRIEGQLIPAPPRARISVQLSAPGIESVARTVTASDAGLFSARVLLPPGTSGSARIRVRVSDTGSSTQSVIFPEVVWRLDVQPAVAVPSAIQPGGDPSQFTFINVDSSGRPAQWDPCRPLTYLVSTSGMPAGRITDVHQAMARLASATGLTVVFGGESSLPATTQPTDLPDSTILIAWSDPATLPILQGPSLGFGGVTSVPTAGDRLRLRNGWVILDRTDPMADGFGRGGSFGQVFLHELGHAVNLDHVIEPVQLMFPYLSPSSPADYQAGDLAGLAQVRALDCLP
jgi:hypothetical protein